MDFLNKIKKLAALTLVVILIACGTPQVKAEESNQEVTERMRNLLIDKWCGNRTDSDGSIQNWAVQRFSDGTYKISFTSQDATGKKKGWGESGIWGIRYPIYFTVTTGFIHGNSEYPANTADSNLYEAYKIMHLSEKEFTYKSYRSDKTFTVTKNCN